MGRLFDAQLLDMFEFGINGDSFQGMDAFEGVRKAVVRVGSKPAMVFQGDAWDSNADLVVLKNFFLDFFRGEVLPKINLSALDRLIVCTASEGGVVHFRHYGVSLKKSNNNLPRVELDEVGPRMDLQLRRRKSASDELVKAALKQPKTVTKAGKNFQKNFGNNAIGDQTARIHMQRQDLANLNVARLKGLKKRKRDDGQSSAAMLRHARRLPPCVHQSRLHGVSECVLISCVHENVLFAMCVFVFSRRCGRRRGDGRRRHDGGRGVLFPRRLRPLRFFVAALSPYFGAHRFGDRKEDVGRVDQQHGRVRVAIGRIGRLDEQPPRAHRRQEPAAKEGRRIR